MITIKEPELSPEHQDLVENMGLSVMNLIGQAIAYRCAGFDDGLEANVWGLSVLDDEFSEKLSSFAEWLEDWFAENYSLEWN